MTAGTAKVLAWGLFGAFAALAVATPVFVGILGGSQFDALVVVGTGYAVVGALVASRHPRNSVGWLLLAAAVTLAVDTFAAVYVAAGSLPGRTFAGWLTSSLLFIWIYLPLLFLPLVFPTGRLLSRRWRVVAWLGAAAISANVLGTALKPGLLEVGAGPPIPNPFGVGGTLGDVLAVIEGLGTVLGLVALALAAVSLVLRLRRSRGRERQQLAWFGYVGVLTLVPFAILGSVYLLAGNAPSAPVEMLSIVAWWSGLLMILFGLPLAIGFAILRYRLYEIDVVINRTLVYGALTLTLGATYVGSVLLLQLALRPVTQESGLAVAASTLAAAALFRPLRSRIQALVDRRFYRSRYDAARTLEAFGARLRDELDLEALAADLREVVRETMQPAHVTLWLRRADR